MRFIISKGQPFYCEFVVKEPGSNTPMNLTGATGTFTLSTIGVNPCIVINALPLTFPNPTNGVAAVSLTAIQTATLTSMIGFSEDGYPLMPTYRGSLNINSTHPIYVELPKVYINDSGTSCPAQP